MYISVSSAVQTDKQTDPQTVSQTDRQVKQAKVRKDDSRVSPKIGFSKYLMCPKRHFESTGFKAFPICVTPPFPLPSSYSLFFPFS